MLNGNLHENLNRQSNVNEQNPRGNFLIIDFLKGLNAF